MNFWISSLADGWVIPSTLASEVGPTRSGGVFCAFSSMARLIAAASSSPLSMWGFQQAPPLIGNALASSIGNAYDVGMNPVQTAVEILGSQAALAARLNVKQPTISEWSRGDRPVPLERCVEIETATNGSVRRWHLRPNDWHRIWPELIGADGAPAPQAQAQGK